MKQHIKAEINVLDRVLYMLEEGSVTHLAERDQSFGDFIDDLYETVHRKSNYLGRLHSHR